MHAIVMSSIHIPQYYYYDRLLSDSVRFQIFVCALLKKFRAGFRNFNLLLQIGIVLNAELMKTKQKHSIVI